MEDDVSYQIDEMTYVNKVIEVESIPGFQHSQVNVEQVEKDNEEGFEEDNEEEFEDSENENTEDVYIERDSEDGQLEWNDSEEDNEDDEFDYDWIMT